MPRPTTTLLLSALISLVPVAEARANCNLIPSSVTSLASTSGTVGQTVAAPGDTVRVSADVTCGGAAGFDIVPGNNTVTLRFEPPGSDLNPGLITSVAANVVGVDNCGVSLCSSLTFQVPDTDGELAPPGDGLGLAGPATILVETGGETVAEIGPLFDASISCDARPPETIFQSFVVLPQLNVFGDIEDGLVNQIVATLDGGDNLLLPFDFRSVLAGAPGDPVFRLLDGTADLEAFSSQPGVFVSVPDDRFVRAFSIIGRPIPPILEVDGAGSVVLGTVDAAESVVRIARLDPANPAAPPLYDLTDRLTGGRGPIVISNPTLASRESAPLASLAASESTVAFARSENIELEDLTIPPDGDQLDFVAQVVDVASRASTNTGSAVSFVERGLFAVPSLVSRNALAAFLEDENGQGAGPQNGDGDTLDDFLRVFESTGTEVTAANLEADIGVRIDSRSHVIDGDQVFFRQPGTVVERIVKSHVEGDLAPDGSTVHVGGIDPLEPGIEYRVSTLARDPITGVLTETSVVEQAGTPSQAGSALDLVVSPDGAHVYFLGFSNILSNDPLGTFILYIFARDPVTGALTLVPGGRIENFPHSWLRFGSSSSHLYAISLEDDFVRVYSRNAGTGLLALVQSLAVTGGTASPLDLDLSADDGHAYIVDDGDSLRQYSRNAVTGLLTAGQVFQNGVGGVTGLESALSVHVPEDGEHVYVLSANGVEPGAVAVFARDAGTGQLTFVTSHEMPPPGVGAAPGSAVMYASLDGSRLYVGTPAQDTFEFRRHPATGELDFLIKYDDVGGRGLTSNAAAQDFLYTFGNTNAVIRPRQRLGVFDAGSAALRPQNPGADDVAVAAGRAVVVTPESLDGFDLNGDGFVDDDVAQLVDASVSPATVHSLEVAANEIAISDDLVAVTVPEANQPGGFAGNGDADDLDEVLAVFRIGVDAGAARNVGVEATAVAAVDQWAAFTTPGGTLQVYDDDDPAALPADRVTDTGQQAEDFVARDGLVALRTCEAEQGGGTDLNQDGDTVDCVMQVWNLATGTLLNTGSAASLCIFPGCDPFFEPYRVRGDTVSFITREEEQSGPITGPNAGVGCLPTSPPAGCDLTGDGDATDTVVTVYNVESQLRQIFQVPDIDDPVFEEAEAKEPFPETVSNQTVLYTQVPECELGVDINENGVVGPGDCSLVVLITGDVDEDGILDASLNGGGDNCEEVENADQNDGDADGLGTACDPEPDSELPGVELCVATPPYQGTGTPCLCDTNDDTVVSEGDLDDIAGAIGMMAGGADPRDADADGAITQDDYDICEGLCTLSTCKPPAQATKNKCGLLGIELVLVLLPLSLRRRARRT